MDRKIQLLVHLLVPVGMFIALISLFVINQRRELEVNQAFPSNTPVPSPQLERRKALEKYDLANHKTATASVFWIGEAADATNDYIANDVSAWDVNWMDSFGGMDDPVERCGYHPCGFIPEENPFYVALPYNDLTLEGERKASTTAIPWFEEHQDKVSVLKNRWVEIVYKDNICYGQWEDVGPLEADDFQYVFGDEAPKNTFGVRAGMDVSPAIRDCLELETNDVVAWKFMKESEVPEGPWKEIITTSPVNWSTGKPSR